MSADNKRCLVCDRDACPTRVPIQQRGGMAWTVALADCQRHRVGWRERALAAEGDLTVACSNVDALMEKLQSAETARAQVLDASRVYAESTAALVEDLRAQLAAARDTNARLNRRAQSAEGDVSTLRWCMERDPYVKAVMERCGEMSGQIAAASFLRKFAEGCEALVEDLRGQIKRLTKEADHRRSVTFDHAAVPSEKMEALILKVRETMPDVASQISEAWSESLQWTSDMAMEASLAFVEFPDVAAKEKVTE